MSGACARWLLLPVLALSIAACTIPVRPTADPLKGTAWRLEAIQSMDDAQGTTRIPESRRFTLRFGTDGRASLELDCNRGSGAWQARVAAPDSGSLTFGPIAVTRAQCPPPRLDERIARDLAYVRSYRLIGGQLFLSLMADGGIYEWSPPW